jgi:HTH-type transcriptional regulator / antitoxin HipB
MFTRNASNTMSRPVLTSMQLGRLLQSARKAKKLSQAAVGARLGLSQKRISALELSPGNISVDQLLALSSVLGLELQIQQKGSPSAASKAEW